MKDKVLFILDSDIATLGLAKSFQEKHDCELYALIDITDNLKSFYQEQNIVTLKKSWNFFDNVVKSHTKPDIEYLASFEKKYKVNLWLLAYTERNFFRFNDYYKFSHDEILSIIEQECKLFEKILDEAKPDFFITGFTNLHYNHLLYLMCKVRGTKVLMLNPVRIHKKSMITNEEEKFDILAKHQINSSKRTLEELQNYLRENTALNEAKEIQSEFISSKLKLLKAALQFLLFSKNSNLQTHYTYYGRTKMRILITSMINVLREKYRMHFINKYFIRELPNNEPFLLFPLQTDPERTLLIGAPFQTDQLHVIKDIAQSLPINYKLYVKEHSTQLVRGWRKISLYKEIMGLPNVRLIHPSVSPEEIIKKCSMVITINSTAGFEAAFYGKPTVIFTNTLYSQLKSVSIVNDIKELPMVILDTLKKKVDVDDLNKLVDDIENNSFDLDLSHMQLEMLNEFYYGGFLVDVELPIPKVLVFLSKNKTIFDNWALEYIKKINQYKEIELKKE